MTGPPAVSTEIRGPKNVGLIEAARLSGAEVVEQLHGIHGVMPHAVDPAAARRLWDVSQELVDTARASTS